MNEKVAVSVPSTQVAARFHTVCKRVFQADPAFFPRAEYGGKVVYFCTGSCLDAFLADPERFYRAHSQPRKY